MKLKHAALLLLTCLLCFACLSAFADTAGDEDIFTKAYLSENISSQTSLSIQDVAWVGDTCYAYLSDMSVYTWQTDGTLTRLCQLPAAPAAILADAVTLTDEDIAQLKETVTYMAGGKDAVYGINVYSGKFGTIDEEGIHWNDVLLDVSCLNPDPEENFFPNRIADCFVDGSTLYAFVSLNPEYASESYGFYGFDLSTGASRTYTVPEAVAVCPMQDGQFLFLCAGSANYSLKQLDAATGKVTSLPLSLADFDVDMAVGGLAYDPESRTMALTAESTVWKSVQGAALTAFALVEDHYLTNESSGALLSDGRYALWMEDGVNIKGEGNQAESKQLTFQGPLLGIQLETNFRSAYPDINFVVKKKTTTAEDLTTLLTTQDSSIDIFEIRADYTYTALKQKRMAAPLTSSALLENLSSMYPAVQNVLTDGSGSLVAYPSRLYLNVYQYNQGFWDLAFKGEEFPTSMESLMDYWLRWEQDYADDYPEIEFVDNFDYAQWCKNIIAMYIRQHDVDGQTLDLFDSDLRTVLEKLGQIAHIRQTAGRHTSFLSMDDYDGMACIFSVNTREAMNAPATLLMTYPEEYLYDVYMYDYTTVTMSFAKQDEPTVDGILYVYVVNPFSTHQEEAQQLIEMASAMEVNPYLYYALYPQCNTPYEQLNFEKDVAFCQEEKSALEAARKEADAEALESIDLQLDYYNQYLNNLEQQRWKISAETIAAGRQQMENVKLHTACLYLGGSGTSADEIMTDACARYTSGLLSLDGFLQELTNKIRMMELEAN